MDLSGWLIKSSYFTVLKEGERKRRYEGLPGRLANWRLSQQKEMIFIVCLQVSNTRGLRCILPLLLGIVAVSGLGALITCLASRFTMMARLLVTLTMGEQVGVPQQSGHTWASPFPLAHCISSTPWSCNPAGIGRAYNQQHLPSSIYYYFPFKFWIMDDALLSAPASLHLPSSGQTAPCSSRCWCQPFPFNLPLILSFYCVMVGYHW